MSVRQHIVGGCKAAQGVRLSHAGSGGKNADAPDVLEILQDGKPLRQSTFPA